MNPARVCAGQSRNCPDLRFAHEQSQDCAANPWFVQQTMDPGFVPQTMDSGFAQDNPGFAQIHALRVTYLYKRPELIRQTRCIEILNMVSSVSSK